MPYRYTHHIPNTPLNMVVRPHRSYSIAYRRRPSRTGQTPLCYSQCSQHDEDFLPGEYFDELPSANSNLQHPSTAAAINIEEHGSRCLCS
ncbi:hypothetical protein M405DRAFT_218171 [Rhizopogon salebrosus TDB-379]|nr:hypothetical protein M405DRAFT_218171 [Rhizopogon salebrosus TDB-379]